MKIRHCILLFLFFSPIQLFAQPDTLYGRWAGELAVGKRPLRLVFEIARDSNGEAPVVYLDVPVQGLRHYRMETAWDSDRLALTVSVRAFGMEYVGRYENDTIRGLFSQNGMNFPLAFCRLSDSVQASRRPQTPVPPFPYHSEEVVFYNRKL